MRTIAGVPKESKRAKEPAKQNARKRKQREQKMTEMKEEREHRVRIAFIKHKRTRQVVSSQMEAARRRLRTWNGQRVSAQ